MATLPAFHDVEFPRKLAYGSVGGPEWKTEIIELGSGREQRNKRLARPRQRWSIGYGVNTQAILDELVAFHYARRGRLHGFRFFDPDDHEATGSLIGTGDGETAEFQLYKIYEEGEYQFARKITRPDADTVRIYLDDVEDSSNWTVDPETGIVTFDSGAEPGSGVEITADFEFWVPMRFDIDWIPKQFSDFQARAAQIELIEVVE